MLPSFLTNIKIIYADVPAMLDGATAHGVLWQAAPERFLLDMPDVARYLVEVGCRVTIEPAAKAKEEVVTRFARMTPLAALLYQQGVLALHAAAVANAQGAVLLAGDSGAGKSTLLAALLQRGWSLLSDDLAVVDMDEEECPIVRPTFPEVALWSDALEKLTTDSDLLPRCDANRYLLSLPDQLAADPQPLRAIYWLGVQSKDDIIRDDLSGGERFRAVSTLLYNSHIADALLDRVVYMRCATAIVRTTPIIHLRRPRGQWSVEGLADVIEKKLL